MTVATFHIIQFILIWSSLLPVSKHFMTTYKYKLENKLHVGTQKHERIPKRKNH